MNASAITPARTAAVAATMDRVKAIEHAQGVTREALDAIKAEMLELAKHESLFPAAEFPPPPNGEKGSKRYLLQEDPDGRFALYMLALNPGNSTKPHDHTTWAVVVGIEGQELNKVYRRIDDGTQEGHARLEQVREVMVEPGTGIALMPEDIHSIHTPGEAGVTPSTRHLHVYGLALEKLDDRLGYDLDTNTVQPYNKAYMTKTANR
jgi:predicted metal-dependent enzyme (double-stranded beta helix superfamily)